jgi:hypothetical protein
LEFCEKCDGKGGQQKQKRDLVEIASLDLAKDWTRHSLQKNNKQS